MLHQDAALAPQNCIAAMDTNMLKVAQVLLLIVAPAIWMKILY